MLTFDRDYDVREEAKRFANNAAVQQEPSTFGLFDLAELLRRYFRLIVGLTLFGAFLAAAITFSLTKIYTASSTLVFDRNDTRPYESVVELQKLERDKSAMDTEMDLVRSREFLGFVVDDLSLLSDPYFNAALAEQRARRLSFWSRWWPFGAEQGAEEARGREEVQALLVTSRGRRDRAITKLANSITVDRKGESLAMTLHVQHDRPAKAAEIANGVASNYVEWTSRLKESAAKNTVQYLRLQAKSLADSIARKEREMAEFTVRSDLMVDPRDDVLRARMAQLNEQFTVARVDEAGAWAKFNEAKLLLETGVDAVGRVLTSELLGTLRAEEGELLRTRAQLTAKYGRNHPLVMDADAEIASNRRSIEEEVRRIVQEQENEAKVATIRVKKFQQEVDRLQKEIQERNLAEIRRRELERDLLTEQKRYDTVVLRLGTFDPEQEEVKATARIASFAEVPREPSFPRPELIIPVGTLVFFLVGIMTTIVIDALDKRIRSARKVESIVKRPNVVSIPSVAGLQPGQSPYHHMLANPHSPFARSMRSLCLAWRSLDLGTDMKVVMLSSAKPGEGKTTCALGMAATATMNGLRTIIVDVDPKPDGAAALLGIRSNSSTPGMYLDGTTDIDSLAVAATEYPFLRVVNARLGFHDHEKLFQELRRRFDLVIVDSPALANDDDAIWLSPHVDAMLVLVAADRTREQELVETIERLSINRAPIIGSVLNFSNDQKKTGFKASGLLSALKTKTWTTVAHVPSRLMKSARRQ